MKQYISCILFFLSVITVAQTIEKDCKFESIKNNNGISILEINTNDSFKLEDGKFFYSLASKDSLKAKGTFKLQSNLLTFNYSSPNDTTRNYNIIDLTNSTLILSENETIYSFSAIKKTKEIAVIEAENKIRPSNGFSMHSLWRGVLGMFVLLIISFLFSANRRAVDWKKVGIGLSIQLIIAIGVLKVNFIQSIFNFIGSIFIEILEYTKAGSQFLFAGMISDMDKFGYIFAFQVLPTIIFFSALTSLLFYLGVIQWLVKILAKVLSKFLGISGMESLSVAGNIFLGQTEAPLLIKAYLEKMNKSEMLLVMVGGMATVAGAVLAAYIGFLGGGDKALELVFAKHLLAASVMAAPGAIVISKILYPQTQKVNTDVTVSQDKIGSNILDAIANGTTEGLKLAVNVGAMLLVFVAVIAMLNGVLGFFGGFDGMEYLGWEITSLNEIIANNTLYEGLSIEFILGYAFAPLMWLVGVASEDMTLMGQLLGIKLAASEFIGYIQLAELKNVANTIHLTHNKSVIMATYMLCGFANFASIGIQIGGIGSLAPGQRKVLSEFGMKALIGGTIASLMSATIAGMIIG
jgi:CNT family concentrative nucleoside transporter